MALSDFIGLHIQGSVMLNFSSKLIFITEYIVSDQHNYSGTQNYKLDFKNARGNVLWSWVFIFNCSHSFSIDKDIPSVFICIRLDIYKNIIISRSSDEATEDVQYYCYMIARIPAWTVAYISQKEDIRADTIIKTKKIIN